MYVRSNRLEMSFVSDKQPEGTGEPTVPDDVWERFARDSERDIRDSAPKEPSARARMVTERLRQQDARETERSSRRNARKNTQRTARPEGWRTGPTWRETDGRAARRRRLWAIIGVPLALAVVVVAMKPSLLPGDPFGTSADASADRTPLPAETAAPTAPPSGTNSGSPTRERPFAGSPAERWADGAAGIVVPKATAVGALTKDQVATGLRQTKNLLVGANLDRATLRGARPGTAIAVLDPRQPGMIHDVNRRLRAPDREHNPLALFSRFDPDGASLVGDVVKTRGRMTFKEGKDASVAIHADYTFVYPVSPAGGKSTVVTRTIVRRVLEITLLDPRKFHVTPGRVTIAHFAEDIGNSACDVYDGFLHPQFGSATAGSAPPTGPTVDPYDRSRDIQHSDTSDCGTVSRT